MGEEIQDLFGRKKNKMKHWPQQMRHLKTAIA